MRRSNCRDILTNKNLLSDNDVVQLLRSYVNDSMLTSLRGTNVQQSTMCQTSSNCYENQSVLHITPTVQEKFNDCDEGTVATSEAMEVFVDPGIFLADEESIIIEDDEETVSAAEGKIETAKLKQLEVDAPSSKKIKFNDSQVSGSNAILKDGTHPYSKTCNKELQKDNAKSSAVTSSSKTTESAVKKPCKKKKIKEEKIKARRKRIVIRINPSPKRNVREKAKYLPKFTCAICRKNLSSKRNLQLHYMTHKDPNGKFKCDGEGCKKLFAKLENYVRHRQEAHEKPARKRKNVNEK